jgi:hypothetical protein
MSKYTRMLFAMPSFASGAARTMDIGGTFDAYNESATPDLADARALAADFMAVAEDMHTAVTVTVG